MRIVTPQCLPHLDHRTNSSEPVPRGWLRWLLRRAAGTIDAAGTLVLLATVVGFLGGLWWFFDLFAHFRAQYAAALAAAMIVAVVRRRNVLALLAGAGLLANGLLLWPLFAAPRAPADATLPVVRVLTFNVLVENQNESGVVEYIRASNADIVLIIEVDSRWVHAIESLREIYPHQHLRPREGPWGMALLSRLPWSSLTEEAFAAHQAPAPVATFAMAGGSFVFVGAHPFPPVSSDGARGRDGFLSGLGSHLERLNAPAIVAGDLNATRWSAPFRKFVKVARLRDSAEGRGWQPTWNAGSLFQIPIDHVLISDQWTVVNRQIGPDLGSDHRPLVVDLQAHSHH